MNRSQMFVMAWLIPSSILLSTSYANTWSNYRGVNTAPQMRHVAPPPHAKPPTHFSRPARIHQNPPTLSSSFNHYASTPQYSKPRPHYPPPRPPQPRPGLTIQYHDPHLNLQYHLPAQQVYQHSSHSQAFVNGSGYIHSSEHTVITDWYRKGLPAPPQGSYWAFEQGRYVLVPHR